MPTTFFAIIASLVISAISLVGIFSLKFSQKNLQRVILFLLALAAGTLMADAFLHLLPESIGVLGAEKSLKITFLAFFAFFLIEKIFQWHHCHQENCHKHSIGYMNLLGDSLHNFIDGLIIAAAFAVDWQIGLGASIAIALHELPQELGDFGVLLHAGFSRKKAIIFNFGTALLALLGVLVGNQFLASEQFLATLLAIAAGGFLYISTSDLLPEIRTEKDNKRLLLSLLFFCLGVLLIYLLAFLK